MIDEKALEAAAMALAAHEHANWYATSFNETPDGSYPDDMRQGYLNAAQAALTALEAAGYAVAPVEPSSAQIDRVAKALRDEGYCGDSYRTARHAYRAMIAASKARQQGEG